MTMGYSRRESDAPEGRWRRYPVEQLPHTSYDFNRLAADTNNLCPSKSHKDLLNQVEANFKGAIEDVRAVTKAVDP